MSRTVLFPALLLGLAATVGWARTPAWYLPDLRLPDPARREHALPRLSGRGGLVLVVTAPTHDQAEAQRGWADRLAAARPAGARVRFALLEDLDQSWFPATARRALRRAHVAGRDPLLLLDETGAARRALGVDAGVTWLLAYDRKGELRFVERGEPSAAGAQRAWEAAGLPPAADERGQREARR
jgi:hypothetical protein